MITCETINSSPLVSSAHPPNLCNNNTNWEAFRLLITEHLQLNVPLKTTHDIEAAINNLIQRAGWASTPEPPKIPLSPLCPLLIKIYILIKRSLRRLWLQYHSPNIKRQLNSATCEFKQLLSDNHNACFQQYIQNLSPTASTDHSLWKAVRKIKHITPSTSSSNSTRHMGSHQHWQGPNLCLPFSICIPAQPLQQLTRGRRTNHLLTWIPLPTRTSTSTLQTFWN
jgi:hypothetical protein